MLGPKNKTTRGQNTNVGSNVAARRRIIVEAPEDLVPALVEELARKGLRVRVEPDPEQVRKRILERWTKTGRRARPGELVGVSLEDEFS